MYAIFLDGESKSGKTAVGRAIRRTLESKGYTVRLVVAGNFFRQVTLLALRHKPQTDDMSWVEAAARDALQDPALYDEVDPALLNSAEVDEIVSSVGQLGFVQAAANGWREQSAQRALDDGIDVVLLDGRNLRRKLQDWLQRTNVAVALELIISCRAEVAATRLLAASGNATPSEAELKEATDAIETRRQMDRNRSQAAYKDPVDPVVLQPGTESVQASLATAFAPDVSVSPRPITFDNSDVPLATGLATVTELSLSSVERQA